MENSLPWLIFAVTACTVEQPLYRIPVDEPAPRPEGGDGDDTGGEGADGEAPIPCDEAGTWATTGQPFALTWCTGCHATGRLGEERHGAPEGLDLDSRAAFVAAGAASLARVDAGTMPPGGGPSAGERARLRAWLDCGAPGAEASLTGSRPDPAPSAAFTLRARVAAGSDTEALRLGWDAASILGEGSGDRVLTELFHQEGDQTALQGWTWLGDSGLLVAVAYDPPLPLQGPAEGWQVETLATLTDAAGSFTEAQTWTLSRAPAAAVDPRAPDLHPDLLLAVEAAGAEQGWLLSPSLGITGRWWLDEAGEGFIIQQALDQPTRAWPAFPLQVGDDWRARMLRIGAWE
jgi:hypothetical protein